MRILVAFAGICGSDLHAIEQLRCRLEDGLEIVFGHEYSGIVIETGGAVEMVAPGQRVVGKPRIPCLHCRYCREDRIWDCENLVRPAAGGWAETIVVHQRFAVPVPDDLPLRLAALTEPLSCCLRAVDKVARGPGHTALVLGAGPIGLMTAALARASGALDILVSEPSPYRQGLAARLGFEVVDPSSCDLPEFVMARTGHRGVDVVYEAVGRAETVETAIACTGRGGTVVVLGVAPASDVASIRPFEFFQKELALIGAWANETTFARALALLPQLDLSALISHEIDLEQGARAIALSASRDCGKVLLLPNGRDPERVASEYLAAKAPQSQVPSPTSRDADVDAPATWADVLEVAEQGLDRR